MRPPVTYGQQAFGNTSSGFKDSDGRYWSWWALSVTSGDDVEHGSHGLSSNGRGEERVTAPNTGVIPIAFVSESCCSSGKPGPYDFTAPVLRAVVLSIPSVSALPAAGTISVGVHNPDGAPINDPGGLSVTFDIISAGSSAPTPVGSGKAVNGTATMAYSVPPVDVGSSVKIEATSAGTAYLAASSAPQAVSIQKPIAPPACVVPTVHHGETLRQMEHAISHNHCSGGHIRRVRSHHRRGLVIAVSPRPATRLASRARIGIVVSRGH